MISHKNKFIFIHIPKTAGSSLEQCFGSQGIVHQGSENFNSIYFKHVTANALQNMMGSEFTHYFKFTIVRNPWDWLISVYEFNRGICLPYIKNTSYKSPGVIPTKIKNLHFIEWIVWFSETFKTQQVDMLSNNKGELLVDHIIKFENLHAGIRDVFSNLSLPFPTIIPSLKASVRKPINHYYKKLSDVELVEKYYSNDIQHFNYSISKLAHKLY